MIPYSPNEYFEAVSAQIREECEPKTLEYYNGQIQAGDDLKAIGVRDPFVLLSAPSGSPALDCDVVNGVIQMSLSCVAYVGVTTDRDELFSPILLKLIKILHNNKFGLKGLPCKSEFTRWIRLAQQKNGFSIWQLNWNQDLYMSC